MDERCGEDRGEVVILAMLQIDFGKYHLDVFFFYLLFLKIFPTICVQPTGVKIQNETMRRYLKSLMSCRA